MLPKRLINVVTLTCCLFLTDIPRAFCVPELSYLGIEHGLSNNSVTCIFQDKKGFIWFGSYDGLNRYDGYAFKVFRNQLNDTSSLPNNRIAAITEDAHHVLWIGTRSGVAKYDQVTSRFSPVYYLPKGGKKAEKITTIVNELKADSNGNMFIATDNGLLLYDEKKGVALPVSIRDENIDAYQAIAIERDLSGRLWICVREKGLFLYEPHSKSIKQVSPQIKNGICLRPDADGTIWMGTDDGLYSYAVGENKFSKSFSSGNRILQLASFDSTFYIVTDGNGIFTLDRSTKQVTPLVPASSKKNLTSPCVYSVLKDREGRIWIGTMRGGINVIDDSKSKFQTIAHDPLNPNSLADNFIACCSEDADGNVWVGTDGSGFSCWNRKQNLFSNYRQSGSDVQLRSSNFVTDILNDSNDNLWIASWGGGISRFNKQHHSFEHFNCFNTISGQADKNPFLIFQDKDQKLWVGTCLEGGLYYFDKANNRFLLYDAKLKNILSMYEDKAGNTWAGDFSSLIQIDKKTKHHRVFRIGYAVRAITEDKHGNFWVGTEGGGLLQFDRVTGKYKRYAESEGLCNNSILKILEDDNGNLWISTFNGVSVFNPNAQVFRNFSQSDGLQSNQFTYNSGLKLRSGEFVFAGIKGLNIFSPANVLNHAATPLTVLLTGMRVDNVPIQENSSYITKRSRDDIESIKLPYAKAVISIDFVALNYSASDKIRYAYYLEGWDKQWNYVGKIRTANYTRLNEGSYTFHVKAIDASGNESEWKENLSIIVLPPWYRSWWAYLIYALIAGSLIVLYVRYKSEQAHQRYQIALAKMETEKEKELNEKKLLFFTNIAHEFRTPLTLIIGPVKDILHQPEKTETSSSGLQIVYRNARRLLSLVDQLLVFRKADTEGDKLHLVKTNFYELCHEVFICFSQQATARSIHYEFHAGDRLPEIAVDREKMEIILFNLLSNALKFTPAGGTVSMELIQRNPQKMEVIVSDTGCGIEQGVGDKLFEKFYQAKSSQSISHKGFGIGLYLSHQLVSAHKGTMHYESVPGKGTRFIVNIPVNLLPEQPKNEEWIPVEEQPETKKILLEELIADLEADAPADELIVEPAKVTERDLQTLPKIISEKKSILLVDDNKSIRQYLHQLFERAFLVYEAENGESGLAMAQQTMPDMIISDVIMGGMTGVEMCRAIKAHPDLSHIPVILLTATTASELKLKGLECGADDYITKPFEKELLLASVENILKNRNKLQQYFLDTITLQKNKTKVSASYKEFLENCIAIIEREIENEDFSIKTFAQKMGMSHSNLYKKVKSVSGLSLNAFIRHLRLRKAALILLSTDTNINQAAYQVGINDIKYFRAQFYKLFGMNPSDYVKKYKATFNKDINMVV